MGYFLNAIGLKFCMVLYYDGLLCSEVGGKIQPTPTTPQKQVLHFFPDINEIVHGSHFWIDTPKEEHMGCPPHI